MRQASRTLSPRVGSFTPSALTLRGSIGPVGDLTSIESRRRELVLEDWAGVDVEGLAVVGVAGFAVVTLTAGFWEAMSRD